MYVNLFKACKHFNFFQFLLNIFDLYDESSIQNDSFLTFLRKFSENDPFLECFIFFKCDKLGHSWRSHIILHNSLNMLT